MKNIQYIYNNIFNIPTRYIFTNCLIENKHLKDPFCNQILQAGSLDHRNSITINSKLLEQYIKDNYNYIFISSITKCLTKEQTIEELQNPLYNYVCINFKYNKDFNFFESIPINLRNKVFTF